MAKRYFNWALAIALVVVVVVLAVAAVALRGWQRGERARRALPLGEQAYAQGDWKDAARQFGRYVAVHQDDEAILLKYADALTKIRPRRSEHLQEAANVYSSVLRLDKGNSDAANRLMELYLEAGWYGEAQLRATQYLENKDDDPTMCRLLSVALANQRKFAEAAARLADLIETHPEEVLAYEIMGQLAKESPDDVNQPTGYWLDEAVRRNPDAALAYAIRASFRWSAGDPNGARADLEQAATLDLSNTDVRLRLAAELINTRALDEAKVHLDILRKETPDDERVYRAWAGAAVRSGSTEEMRAVAEEGLKVLAKQPWDFMPIAAELFIRAGEIEEATKCIERMRQDDVLPAVAAFLVGRVAESQGKMQEAADNWERAISLGYDDRYLRPYEALPVRMALALALARMGEVPSAIAQMRTLVSEASGRADAAALQVRDRLLLAQLLAQVGDWSGVIEQTRQVQQLSPGHTGATLQEVRARIQLLVAGDEPPGGRERAWRDIERQLVRLSEMPDNVFQVGVLRVRAAIAQGKYAEADSLLNEIGSGHPPSQLEVTLLRAELCRAQGQSYRDEGREQEANRKDEEAVSLLRQAMEKYRDEREPVRRLASLLEGLKKTQECESVISQAMARAEQPETRCYFGLLLADTYDRWGQNDKRDALLADLGQQFPDDIRIKRRLLAIESVAGDPVRAQKLVDEIKSLEGEDGWQWRVEQAKLWVNSQAFSDHYPEIVEVLQENLAANNPLDTASRLLLGAAYEKAGEVQLALATYRDALNRRPDDVRIIVRLVTALNKAGETDEAARILDRAAQSDLYHPQLRRLQLLDDLRRGALASASNTLEVMIEQDPNDAGVALTLALVLVRQKRFDEAQTILDDLKAANPQAMSVTAAQVQLYVAQGDADKAMQLCDETVKRFNNAVAHLLRARTHAILNQRDEALEDFSQAVSLEPGEPDVWLARADFYYGALGQIDEAIADVGKALALAPDRIEVQRLAISLLIDARDRPHIQQAEKLLDGALATRPEDSDLKYQMARLLVLKNTAPATEEARRLLADVTTSNPRFADAWSLLGRLEMRERKFRRVVDIALSGLVENPENRQLLWLKAQAEGQLSPMLAIPTLTLLVEQEPNDVDAVIQLAYTYVRSDRAERAVELLREHSTTLTGPARRRCEIALAAARYESGDKDTGKAEFDRLMEAEPDDPAPVLALAQLYRAERNWTPLKQLLMDWCSRHPTDVETPNAVARTLFENDEAAARQTTEELLRTVLQRNPASIGTLHLLAMLVQALGRDDESAVLNRRILTLDPNDTVATNNLAWFLCERRHEYQEALELANKGLALVPEYADLIDTRGVIHYRMRHFDDAIRDLTRCIELYSADTPALTASRFHLGRVYAAKGLKTEAVEQLEQSLALQNQIGGLTPSEAAEAERLLAQLQRAD